VLVFGNGAVIRLNSPVAAGQLLFVTNEKTKKEVVCQVVKSKNYRSVSGYVELEFTEPVVGFWGMRFPGDRIATPPQPAVSSPPAIGSSGANVTPMAPRPDVPKVEAPAAPLPVTPLTPAALMPDLAGSAIPVRPSAPVVSPFDSPSAHEAKASILAPAPQAPAAAPTVNVTSLDGESERKDSSPTQPESVRVTSSSDPETEALKQHTARLQEQLSSMQFSEGPSSKPAEKAAAPHKVGKAPSASATPKVLEMAYSESHEDFSELMEPAKPAPPPVKTSLDDEELKIPAWLEPLARNASAPTSTQELIERDKAKRVAEQKPKVEEPAEESYVSAEEEGPDELRTPSFGNELSFGEEQRAEAQGSRSPRKSSRGLLMGALAASLLLLAGGGWWYLRPQLDGVRAGDVARGPQATTSAAAVIPGAEVTQPLPQATPPAQNNSSAQVESVSKPNPPRDSAVGSTPGIANAVVRNGIDKNGASNSKRNNAAVTVAAVQPPPEPGPEPKKPALGEVRLATPKVTHRRNAQVSGDSDPGLALEADRPETDSGEALGVGLDLGGKQPAAPQAQAPIPVGGDVKPAKLVNSVAPVYPTLAKNQHVSGNVQVDALIDANGRVTTMKIVSGPTLLHQAAKDALKQWKYQPATLDGKAVPMHLTVTIQFRLQ